MNKSLLLIPVILLAGCIPRSDNVDWIKARAVEAFRQQGFEIVGYEGYNMRPTYFGSEQGGACVWYVLRKIPDNGLTYEACLQRWDDEVHQYELKAIDAIRPNE